MARRITLKNKLTNQRRDAYVGFSWTTLFFNFWPAVFRGAWRLAIMQFVIALLGLLITFGIVTFIACIYFAINFNEMHMRELINDGFEPIE